MIKIAICDDEKELLCEYENRILKFMNQEKIVAKVETYQSGYFLLSDIEENRYFDLIFLDIEMPGMNGMEIAEKLKNFLPHILIIFITLHNEYVYDSFELSVFRFIPKYQIDKRINQVIKDAVSYIMMEQNEAYTIETQNRMERILYKDILYITKSGKNSIITTFKGESKVRKNLRDVFEEINKEEFFYIDRGCIVNIIHIMQLVNGEVEMKNGEWLATSRSNKKATKDLINKYWGKSI